MTERNPPATRQPQRWRQYLRFVGPWPLRPWVVGFAVGLAVFIVSTARWRETDTLNLGQATAETLALVFSGTATIVGTTALANRLLSPKAKHQLAPYLLALAASAVMGSIAMFIVVTAFGTSNTEPVIDLSLRALRIWVWLVLVSAVTSATLERLGKQTRIAENSLHSLSHQQSLMLIHEENSRRQLAALLHDKVQAQLMTACLELKLATSPDRDVDRTKIEGVISRLDDIRGLDIHQAVRALSPDLANIGLHSALQDLVRSYEPRLTTSLTIAPEIINANPPIPIDIQLACYRIVEQAVLNSVIHGQATHCVITIETSPDRHVRVNVTDNGVGAPTARAERTEPDSPGFGSAVLDSWCRVLGGTWKLQLTSTGGAQLAASLPLHGGSVIDLHKEGMSLQ